MTRWNLESAIQLRHGTEAGRTTGYVILGFEFECTKDSFLVAAAGVSFVDQAKVLASLSTPV